MPSDELCAKNGGEKKKSAAVCEDYRYYEDCLLLSLQGDRCVALLCKPGGKRWSSLREGEIVQN